jgi:hypothetical protein
MLHATQGNPYSERTKRYEKGAGEHNLYTGFIQWMNHHPIPVIKKGLLHIQM